MSIHLIGTPLDLGSERIGVDMGPNALRYQKFVEKLTSAGMEIVDHGNITCPSPEDIEQGNSRIKYLEPITDICSQLRDKSVSFLNNPDDKLLVLGGDHSVAMGSVSAAVTKGSVGVIWIDAHPDLNTDQTTPSGNIHGMPAAALLGFGHEKLTNISPSTPAIETENIIFIGLKDVDPPEGELIQKENLTAFHIRDILASGLGPIFNAIDKLNERVDHIWLSFDLDGVDADHAPGVGMPNKGGLTYREIYAIIEYIGETCDILGMDLVEYNPVNDIEHKTANLATELVAKAFGKEYSWYSEYLETHAV